MIINSANLPADVAQQDSSEYGYSQIDANTQEGETKARRDEDELSQGTERAFSQSKD